MVEIKPCSEVLSLNPRLLCQRASFFFGGVLKRQDGVHPEGTVSKEYIRCQSDIRVILQSEVELEVRVDLRPPVPGASPSGVPWVQGLQSI